MPVTGVINTWLGVEAAPIGFLNVGLEMQVIEFDEKSILDVYASWKTYFKGRKPDSIVKCGPFDLRVFKSTDAHVVFIKLGKIDVGYLQLDLYKFMLQRVGRVHCYIPHIYLKKKYRGLGLAKILYCWISNTVPMLSNYRHSPSANKIWASVAKKKGARILFSSEGDDNDKEMMENKSCRISYAF